MERPKYIIVIGASAGGVNALKELVKQFRPEMSAAFFIVVHLSRSAISDYLVSKLQPVTSLRCTVAKDAMPIEIGNIYIAPPNEHLIVIKDQIVVGHGPEENRWRPSIDVLFRSSAAAYNARVVGIILTGLLNDGTSGMLAIKRSGGTCIVQDPDEAEFPDMPLSVLNTMEADHCSSLKDIGNILNDILKTEPQEKTPPDDVIAEAAIVSNMAVGIEHVQRLGEHSVYSCPDCGGGLWKVEGDMISRYRCHIGHAYEEKDLLIKQGEKIEATLWIALRMMEERHGLFLKMALDHNKKGLTRIAGTYQSRAAEMKTHVEKLRRMLVETHKEDQIRN